MPSKALVLDANILIRAVLGQRVRRTLETHADAISFFIPETAYAEAEEHLAALVAKRGGEPEKALRSLRSLAALGTVMTRRHLRRLRN
jgi:predicted nucleic acid-binding protein